MGRVEEKKEGKERKVIWGDEGAKSGCKEIQLYAGVMGEF